MQHTYSTLFLLVKKHARISKEREKVGGDPLLHLLTHYEWSDTSGQKVDEQREAGDERWCVCDEVLAQRVIIMDQYTSM